MTAYEGDDMPTITKRMMLGLFAGLGLCLLLSRPALAQIKDPTATFSPQAIQKAQAAMEQIKQKYKTEFLVEVFPQAPVEVRNAAGQQRGAAVKQWTESRARELKVDGIYVLISREPNVIQPWVGQNTSKALFTQANQNELGALILRHFRDG
jgi:hypothetical protein